MIAGSDNLIFLLVAFFLIAFLYASVGFGGGSSYLALLALPVFALPFPAIRAAALCCNLVVVTGGTWIYWRRGELSLRDFAPFLLSVPAAYVGGSWLIREHTFFMLLGSTLLVVSGLLWWQPGHRTNPTPVVSDVPAYRAGLGAAIGLLSGMVGIGGGIFLSPVMHLLRWSDAKKIAATASAFILVNSVGGLAGQLYWGIPDLRLAWIVPLLLAVLAGGQLGTRVGTTRFNPLVIRRITALLILVASIHILKEHWLR